MSDNTPSTTPQERIKIGKDMLAQFTAFRNEAITALKQGEAEGLVDRSWVIIVGGITVSPSFNASGSPTGEVLLARPFKATRFTQSDATRLAEYVHNGKGEKGSAILWTVAAIRAIRDTDEQLKMIEDKIAEIEKDMSLKDAEYQRYRKAIELLDSEYDNFENPTAADIWDYLSSAIPDIKRETSDQAFGEIWGDDAFHGY